MFLLFQKLRKCKNKMTEIIGTKMAEPAQIKCRLCWAFPKPALWSKKSMPHSDWMNINPEKQSCKIRRSRVVFFFFCLSSHFVLIRSSQFDQTRVFCFAFSCSFDCRLSFDLPIARACFHNAWFGCVLLLSVLKVRELSRKFQKKNGF